MTKLTQAVIDFVEQKHFDEDIAQDFYVKWMEHNLDIDAVEDSDHLTNILNGFLYGLLKNELSKTKNRNRLIAERAGDIANLYGYNNTADDPLDIIVAEELEAEILSSMSDLEQDIYGRYQNGQGYPQIARDLIISEVAARKHMSRIKGKFNGKTHNKK